jgi:glucose-1-phosphate adenylyltransferase
VYSPFAMKSHFGLGVFAARLKGLRRRWRRRYTRRSNASIVSAAEMSGGDMRSALAIVLAGGRGTRLEPLTRDRAKPAVPFGGQYRIVDFVLSNCVNSGLRRILVLTQYKAVSLDRHINAAWRFLSRDLDEYIDIVPPQQRVGEFWYRGTADAIYQNIYSIEQARAEYCLILGGDHIYKMDYGKMLDFHIAHDADLTIGCIPVPRAEASRFGVLAVDDADRIVEFAEKPADPKPIPGRPDEALASMGVYVFRTELMYELLCEDATRTDSSHDFGKDVVPTMLAKGCDLYGYAFRDERTGGPAYWRDVGTLDEYYACTMDLVAVSPTLNLYDRMWPIRTRPTTDPPPKFVFSEPGEAGAVRRGEAHESIVCSGAVISGGCVERSVVSRNARVNSYAVVQDSILFENVEIGRNCRIRRAIIDKDVVVPSGERIGFDREHDVARGFTITEGGLTVIPKAENIAAFLEARKRRASE